MTPHIKKIIAREGLVFLIVVISIVGFLLEQHYFKKYTSYENSLTTDKVLIKGSPLWNRMVETRDNYYGISQIFHQIGFYLLELYAFYLLIRFIIWAVRTLKAK